MLTFDPSDEIGATHCVNIPVLDDNIVEEPETFTATLGMISEGAEVGLDENSRTALVTIISDIHDSKLQVSCTTVMNS